MEHSFHVTVVSIKFFNYLKRTLQSMTSWRLDVGHRGFIQYEVQTALLPPKGVGGKVHPR